jgi:hypothetical protein
MLGSTRHNEGHDEIRLFPGAEARGFLHKEDG